MSEADPGPRRQYNAAGTAALLVIGLLFLIPSGICTSIFGGGALLDAFTNPNNVGDSLSVIFAAILFGGPFIAFGAVMLLIGIRRLRGR